MLRVTINKKDGTSETIEVVSVELFDEESDDVSVTIDSSVSGLSPDERLLAFVNDELLTTFDVLDVDVGLDARAAASITTDRPYASIEDLDRSSYVGPAAFKALRAYVNKF